MCKTQRNYADKGNSALRGCKIVEDMTQELTFERETGMGNTYMKIQEA